MVGGRCGLAVMSGLVHATPHPCWCHLEIHLHADEESGRVVAKKCRDRLVTEVVSQTLGKRGHVWVGINLLGSRGIWLQSEISKFQTHFNDKYLKYFLWNCYQMNASTPRWSLVNIGSGNGLMPSGHQATSHYLSQCWYRSVSSYGVTRPQWVNSLRPRQNGGHFVRDILKCIF